MNISIHSSEVIEFATTIANHATTKIDDTNVTSYNMAKVNHENFFEHHYSEVNGELVPYVYHPQYLSAIYSTIASIVFVVGIFGNIIVQVVLIKNENMRNSMNIFLFNLTITDILWMLITRPVIILVLNKPVITLSLGTFMCYATKYIDNVAIVSSVLSFLGMSFERYYVICRPFQARTICTKKRATYAVLLIWVLSFILAIPGMFSTIHPILYGFRGGECGLTSNKEISFWMYQTTLLLFSIIPLIILIILFYVIKSHLKSEPLIRTSRATFPTEKKQVVNMLAIVIAIYFLCNTPRALDKTYSIFSSLLDCSPLSDKKSINLKFFTDALFSINFMINPIIYNIMSARYRSEFKKLFLKS